jgi:phenylalanyl-tRNA synthetase alpha chain
MTDDLSSLEAETAAALLGAADLRAWDAVRVGVLGKSGRLTLLLKALGALAPEERRARGEALNALRARLAPGGG